MSFELQKKEPVNVGIARIISEQVDDIVQQWQSKEQPASVLVHNARKSCKMIRGAMRLVRPRFDEYSEENNTFRDAARLLAASRQSTALIESFDDLIEHLKKQSIHVNFDRLMIIRHVLTLHNNGDSDDTALSAEFLQAMQAARKRVDQWHIHGKRFAAIEGGLKKTYSDGRDAMRTAMDETTVENLHEWRKQLKYHWYHMRILRPIWKPMMKTWAGQLERLSDLLGDDHDLAMLRIELENRQAGSSGDLKAAIEELLPMVDTRQAEFREAAFALGRHVYAESPSALVGRMRSYWKSWAQH